MKTLILTLFICLLWWTMPDLIVWWKWEVNPVLKLFVVNVLFPVLAIGLGVLLAIWAVFSLLASKDKLD